MDSGVGHDPNPLVAQPRVCLLICCFGLGVKLGGLQSIFKENSFSISQTKT
ncbi:hypothetical protein HanXRQr2_Chr09g0378511 [Helianthus annuus]|uniref:Uncharacterized protein n=1 Tax=Helianthus annuus TaxID=4232 RepID=A0A9K3I430_HELAN|nr:hypothetical protein HanXRQr2_Chr09g0378511 [Helianthus annuus]KAJ0815358.1 hypothetical protein HanPSC8_Chr17g0796591 [Helianthus annuus]